MTRTSSKLSRLAVSKLIAIGLSLCLCENLLATYIYHKQLAWRKQISD
jgi:hypothetical protein